MDFFQMDEGKSKREKREKGAKGEGEGDGMSGILRLVDYTCVNRCRKLG